MKNLALHNLELIDDVISPDQFINLSLFSPATDFFTDFKKHKPLVIGTNTLAKEALVLMQRSHVQMQIVVSDTYHFIGVISTRELTEQAMMQKVSNGEIKEELTVGDMMIPREKLQAFSYDDVAKSSIQYVIDTLKNNGLQHCLVLDKENHQIRGVISASDLARKLHLPIEIHAPTSFTRIFQAVNE